MRNQSLHRALALSLMSVTSIVIAGCGGGSSPTSPAETSFLTGTWNGTITISRTGQPDIAGPVSWTFDLVPQTSRQQFSTTIRSQNSFIPVTATSAIVLTPTGDPPGVVGGTGHYSSPRGCTGDFVIVGSAAITAIDAAFDGVDCDDGSGVRVPFSGRIRVAK